MHALDRPLWSALTGPQTALARGDARAWRLDPAMGHFAAAADPADVAALAPLLAADGRLILFEDTPVLPPPGVAAHSDTMVQMVADALAPPVPGAAIERLGGDDGPEMLALAILTKPGPFLPGTHRFGGFVGIRDGDRLVAMAGTRLRVPGFVEVSAVCTHPDHRGHGHAARLMQAVAADIVAGGDRPCLHAYAGNAGAIALYERLGFRIRRTLVVTFLTA